MLEPYIQGLERDRDTIADNLTAMGVEATHNETFTSLAPKILDISSGAEPNIFVQTTEPETKDGIWVQSDLTYDDIVIDDDVYIQNNWIDHNDVELLPMPDSFSTDNIAGIQVGNEVYFFYYNTKAFKYNLLTNTYTSLTACPGNLQYLYPGDMKYDNGKIYIYAEAPYDTMYIYNINNDSWDTYVFDKATYFPDSSFGPYHSKFEIINGLLYLWFFGYGGYYSSSNNYAYKIDMSTDTYTPITKIPIESRNYGSTAFGSCVKFGNYIYLFGIYDNYKNVFKYDIQNDTMQKIATTNNLNISLAYSGGIIIGDYYYINPSFSSNKSSDSNFIRNKIIRFNSQTELFEEVADIFPGYTNMGSLAIANYNNKIYLMGGFRTLNGTSSSMRTTLQLGLNNKTYSNNSLIISQGTYYKTNYTTNLFTINSIGKILNTISDVNIYNSSILYSNLPTYIGNGTSWVQIK